MNPKTSRTLSIALPFVVAAAFVVLGAGPGPMVGPGGGGGGPTNGLTAIQVTNVVLAVVADKMIQSNKNWILSMNGSGTNTTFRQSGASTALTIAPRPGSTSDWFRILDTNSGVLHRVDSNGAWRVGYDSFFNNGVDIAGALTAVEATFTGAFIAGDSAQFNAGITANNLTSNGSPLSVAGILADGTVVETAFPTGSGVTSETLLNIANAVAQRQTNQSLFAKDVPVTLENAAGVALITVPHNSTALDFPQGFTSPSAVINGTDLAPMVTFLGIADPNADRIVFWDDSAGVFTYLTIGSGLTITGTTIDASATGGTNFAGTITTNVAAYTWSWQGRNTNQVIDASKTNRVSMAPSNSTTVAFANLPSAGSPEQTIELMVLWTNMPTAATFTWPAELVWPQGTPVLVNNATNFFDLKWKGTNWYGFAYQGPTTGTSGTNVLNVSPTIFTPTITSPTINGQSITLPLVQRVATNYAHATSIAVDCSNDIAANITNSTSANVSLLLTNVVPNTSGRLSVTSDGSSRTFNVFAGISITMISTNETLNSTQLVTTASKRMLINWAATLETPTKTNLLVWAKSQP